VYPSIPSTAIRIDKFLGTKEKISSAILVKAKTPFEQALILESILSLRESSLSGIAKRKFRKLLITFLIFLIVSILLFAFLPETHWLIDKEKKKTSEGLHLYDAIKVLQTNEREWEQIRDKKELLKETSKLIDKYNELKKRLQKANAVKRKMYNPKKQKELLSELSNLRNKIEKKKKELDKLKKDVQKLEKSKPKAGEADKNKSDADKEFEKFKQNLSEGEFTKASKSLKNLTEMLKKEKDNQTMRDKIAEKMRELSEQFDNEKMRELLEKLSSEIEGESLQELDDSQLKELMDTLENLGDLQNLADNLQLLELMKNKLGDAKDEMTG